MEMTNIKNYSSEDEERQIFNSIVKNAVERNLGEIKGQDVILHYSGDMDCILNIENTHVATVACKDRKIHYIRLYGDNEQEVDIDVDKINSIQNEIDMIDFYMQNNNLITIELQ
ncbi:hypothetical protein [Clostridium autoethanogenum]|uniref:Uncharacterized protein n=1 Tax=Clostridium autoethanogenum DSM 10061 TaxID=1341692 RepID=A0ABM5NZK8_9CLOT|nr:hypothetical protein [Clostridium autoethanogenum]AGY77965.1 hypothetical protein CAETHG_3764 [Clostridium autoethanogenum DSM 10061]ALU38099.1 Hypothetical protein CLAU_3672 [Clostridium autoethanogenum DSM 10061]OVY50863.1 hypothetical protein WX72_02024 [Clostridium autoethanogenum]